jgi:hypothetical protein
MLITAKTPPRAKELAAKRHQEKGRGRKRRLKAAGLTRS